jgi:glycosyltransferase involved in cell wall biosynthesis
MDPIVSVVICTRNRVNKLKRCIEALRAVRTSHPWELIVVDNGSNDGTSEYLASLPPFDGVPLASISFPRAGTGAARNAAWRSAKGKFIACIDDDCYVAETYIDAIVAKFTDQWGFLGGKVLLYDETDIPITIQLRETEQIFHPCTFMLEGEVHGANEIFRRDVLERIEGFDENFGPGTRFVCDDVDAQARVLWDARLPGLYCPDIVVYHHHGRKAADERRIMAIYYRAIGAYHAKFILNPESRRNYLRIIKIRAIERWKEGNLQRRLALCNEIIRAGLGGIEYLLRPKRRKNRS